jgi:hypothetical protein
LLIARIREILKPLKGAAAGCTLNAAGRMVICRSQPITLEALTITIFFSSLLTLLALGAYVWDWSNRRTDGHDRDALRPLDDDLPPPA